MYERGDQVSVWLLHTYIAVTKSVLVLVLASMNFNNVLLVLQFEWIKESSDLEGTWLWNVARTTTLQKIIEVKKKFERNFCALLYFLW